MLSRVTWEDINVLSYMALVTCVYLCGVGVGRGQESREGPERRKEKGFKGAGREGNRTRDRKVGRDVLGTKGTEWGIQRQGMEGGIKKPN